MEASGLLEEKVVGILYFLDGAREDDGDALVLLLGEDIRGEESLTGVLLEVKDLADGGTIGLDPVDEEDAGVDTYGMVGVFALLISVDGVTAAPEEVIVGDVLDGGAIRGEVQVESLADEGGVGGLDGGSLLVRSLVRRVRAVASREEEACRERVESKQAHRLSR